LQEIVRQPSHGLDTLPKFGFEAAAQFVPGTLTTESNAERSIWLVSQKAFQGEFPASRPKHLHTCHRRPPPANLAESSPG
jgi:hypothetical protein